MPDACSFDRKDAGDGRRPRCHGRAMLTGFYVTALVMLRSLLPPRPGSLTAGGGEATAAPAGHLTVAPEDIPRCLAGLSRAAGKGGELALFFPGCRAPAAPFLLFRLKREGYSNCRAIATADGLLVEATR